VEFAIVSPVLFLVILGILAFGYVIGIQHGVQQLASEAARASVGGLSNAERAQIARAFIDQNLGAYPLLRPARLSVEAAPGASASSFAVSLTYDLSDLPFYRWNIAVLPGPIVQRRAVVLRGGY
jgi:Flp pilus assembly protein TadG